METLWWGRELGGVQGLENLMKDEWSVGLERDEIRKLGMGDGMGCRDLDSVEGEWSRWGRCREGGELGGVQGGEDGLVGGGLGRDDNLVDGGGSVGRRA